MKTHDTPTICNAIEVAQGRPGFDGFTHRMMFWSGPPDLRVVGSARAARIAGRTPPQETSEDIRARRMNCFRSIAAAPRSGAAVVKDMDGNWAVGASWGEINARIHAGVFGLDGVLTKGVMRDLGDMPHDFPVFAGAVGPSHGFVHFRETGTPARVTLPCSGGHQSKVVATLTGVSDGGAKATCFF